MSIDFSVLLAPAFRAGSVDISFGALLAALVFGLSAVWMTTKSRGKKAEADGEISNLLKTQSELHGRIAAMAETLGTRQNEMGQTINQRLDGMSQRLGETLTEQTRSTHENLSRLQERLAVIDAAQGNIQDLAKDVVGLQAILSNKQTRGAFGQARMETLIADALPAGAFQLQPTLSNNVDAGLEYYFNSLGVVSANAFYKDLSNYRYVLKYSESAIVDG
ncbi:MAG: DNA recombination protein RmuC, partial [Rhizobium oryzihabitans]